MEYFLKAKKIVSLLVEKGFIAYFAGGWVRDFLLGEPSEDIDIATDASIEILQEIFPNAIAVGAQFGVLVVPFEGAFFEVATFRQDGSYVNGRHPVEVLTAIPKEDAQRRDFTLNGLFYDPLKEQILDFVEGEKDLRKGIIKAIGDPLERFEEDRLRMVRAARFSCRYGFPIEEETKKAILIKAPTLFPAVSIERIVQEFGKMGEKKILGKGLALLEELQLLKEFFSLFLQKQTSLSKQILKKIDEQPFYSVIIPLIDLFNINNKEDVVKFCENLKLSRKDLKLGFLYLDLKENFLSESPLFWVFFLKEELSKAALHCFSSIIDKNLSQKLLEKVDKLEKEYALPILRASKGKKVLQGEDLFYAGVKKGPLIGILIEEGEKISILEKIEDKKILLEKLKKTGNWPKSDRV